MRGDDQLNEAKLASVLPGMEVRPMHPEEIQEIFSLTASLKKNRTNGFQPLAGKTAALIFEKPSLRTHVSFEVGIAQLGGQSVYLSQQSIGLATRESVRDVAEVLSRYNDLIIARTMRHATVEDLARYSGVPVINALTDLLHPCQIMADAFTLIERGLFNEQTKITFVGDGNNVVNSWLELAEKIPFHFVLACPPGYEPDKQILDRAQRAQMSKIEIIHDPMEAAEGAEDVKRLITWGGEFAAGKPIERFGNGIDWEKAEALGLIKPVDFLEEVSIRRPKLKIQKDFNLEPKVEGMPKIIFSHKKHTVWNGCEVCHPEIFIGVKKGSTKYSMIEIFDGKFCGVCHGKVAFPTLDCQRCHTKPVS